MLKQKIYSKNNGKTKLDKCVEYLTHFWWKYIIYIMSTSIVLMFISSIIYDKVVTINVLNSWVGIILGLVATVIGIISMVLSFYNLDQSVKTQKETLEKIESIKKEIIDYIDRTNEKTMNLIQESNNNKPDIINAESKGWNNVEK